MGKDQQLINQEQRAQKEFRGARFRFGVSMFGSGMVSAGLIPQLIAEGKPALAIGVGAVIVASDVATGIDMARKGRRLDEIQTGQQ